MSESESALTAKTGEDEVKGKYNEKEYAAKCHFRELIATDPKAISCQQARKNIEDDNKAEQHDLDRILSFCTGQPMNIRIMIYASF